MCQALLLHEAVDVALVHLQAVLQLPLGLQLQAADRGTLLMTQLTYVPAC